MQYILNYIYGRDTIWQQLATFKIAIDAFCHLVLHGDQWREGVPSQWPYELIFPY